MQPVRFRGQTTYLATTAVGTTTAGSFVQLTVAGNSSAIFGAEIATVSTLFARYRINKLKVSVGAVFSASNRYLGVKYVGENTSAPGVVTCLSLLDGMHSAASMPPSVKNPEITLTTKELASSGLEWRECDDSAEALGVYGELTLVQELPGGLVVHFEWDISFADLASSGLHLTPFGRQLGKMQPSQLIALHDAHHARKGADDGDFVPLEKVEPPRPVPHADRFNKRRQ